MEAGLGLSEADGTTDGTLGSRWALTGLAGTFPVNGPHSVSKGIGGLHWVSRAKNETLLGQQGHGRAEMGQQAVSRAPRNPSKRKARRCRPALVSYERGTPVPVLGECRDGGSLPVLGS